MQMVYCGNLLPDDTYFIYVEACLNFIRLRFSLVGSELW